MTIDVGTRVVLNSPNGHLNVLWSGPMGSSVVMNGCKGEVLRIHDNLAAVGFDAGIHVWCELSTLELDGV